jgi:hypothetical protein
LHKILTFLFIIWLDINYKEKKSNKKIEKLIKIARIRLNYFKLREIMKKIVKLVRLSSKEAFLKLRNL